LSFFDRGPLFSAWSRLPTQANSASQPASPLWPLIKCALAGWLAGWLAEYSARSRPIHASESQMDASWTATAALDSRYLQAPMPWAQPAESLTLYGCCSYCCLLLLLPLAVVAAERGFASAVSRRWLARDLLSSYAVSCRRPARLVVAVAVAVVADIPTSSSSTHRVRVTTVGDGHV